MKLRQSQVTKGKLSNTLRNWLPILQSDIESLKETLDEYAKENPFIEIKSANEVESSVSKKSYLNESYQKNAISDEIEALSTDTKSLYDVLYEQIVYPLFPTYKSKDIAYEIINNINEEGYFEGDIEDISKKLNVTKDEVESVRNRFAKIEPPGIGAKDLKESFLFQLEDLDLPYEIYKITHNIITNFEILEQYQKEEYFSDALKVIKKFKNPPALDYSKSDIQIIPDIFIYEDNGKIEVKLNNSYYPDIIIDQQGLDNSFDYVKEKIKDAKQLIDALEMRKATLYKIALMIVEYQYEFFLGGPVKPMKLNDLAEELDRHHSTISRAVSNKYIACNRGILPMKSFFATALGDDKDTSNAEIKSFLQNVIKKEDRKKPLSDNKILQQIEDNFKIKIGRRTVTKYRMQLNIASSGERKKLYLLETY